MPLAKRFLNAQYSVKVSTRTASRIANLKSDSLNPFIVDLDLLNSDHQISAFFDSDILIINIPYKDFANFKLLIQIIKASKVKKILFVSSTSVYQSNNQIVRESDNLEDDNSPLRKIEKLFVNNIDFETTIVRFAGLIGKNRNPAYFFKKGRTIKKPDANVNMIHLDDCLNIMTQLVEKNIWGDAFNCAADTHPSKREFYTQAAKNSGCPAPTFDESSVSDFKIIDNSKIKNELDYKFIHSDLLFSTIE